MRRTLQVLTLAFAWLCANGALWDGVQVFAWAKMASDNARIMPLTQAIARALDGTASCEICSVVDDVKQSQPAQQVERSPEKVLLACQAPEKFLAHVPATAWPGVTLDAGPARTDPVPVPPPRC